MSDAVKTDIKSKLYYKYFILKRNLFFTYYLHTQGWFTNYVCIYRWVDGQKSLKIANFLVQKCKLLYRWVVKNMEKLQT